MGPRQSHCLPSPSSGRSLSQGTSKAQLGRAPQPEKLAAKLVAALAVAAGVRPPVLAQHRVAGFELSCTREVDVAPVLDSDGREAGRRGRGARRCGLRRGLKCGPRETKKQRPTAAQRGLHVAAAAAMAGAQRGPRVEAALSVKRRLHPFPGAARRGSGARGTKGVERKEDELNVFILPTMNHY